MYSVIEADFSNVSRRDIISVIRKWFRKKRDENGQKVFNACISIIQPLVNSGTSIEIVKESIANDEAFYQRLLAESNLDIAEPVSARNFLMQKVDAYISRRILNQ